MLHPLETVWKCVDVSRRFPLYTGLYWVWHWAFICCPTQIYSLTRDITDYLMDLYLLWNRWYKVCHNSGGQWRYLWTFLIVNIFECRYNTSTLLEFSPFPPAYPVWTMIVFVMMAFAELFTEVGINWKLLQSIESIRVDISSVVGLFRGI